MKNGLTRSRLRQPVFIYSKWIHLLLRYVYEQATTNRSAVQYRMRGDGYVQQTFLIL